jgi:uncharacterized protein (DUF2267 family)
MNFDEFTGQAQNRLGTADTGQTLRAIRATLSTLGSRIPEENAADLAASLPIEIKWYLTGPVTEHGQRFDWPTFVDRVSEIEGCDGSDAAYHARVIVALVSEVAPRSDVEQLRDMLPGGHGSDGWGSLFELVDAATDTSGNAE